MQGLRFSGEALYEISVDKNMTLSLEDKTPKPALQHLVHLFVAVVSAQPFYMGWLLFFFLWFVFVLLSGELAWTSYSSHAMLCLY